MKNKADLIAEIQSIKDFETTGLFVEDYANGYQKDKNLNAVVVKGEMDIISVVSNKYKLVQFRDVFIPAIQNIPELDGFIATYRGKASLFIFPQGDIFTGEQGSRIGIQLKNSVDKSTAIEIGFAILINGYSVALPSQAKPFRKLHTGQPLELTTDFLEGLDGIKNAWKAIVEKYKQFDIDAETKESIYKELKLTKKVRARIDEKEVTNLWDLFMETLNEVSRKNFKSDIHKQKKIQKIVDVYYQFCIGVAI